jgi:hypothetical protein
MSRSTASTARISRHRIGILIILMNNNKWATKIIKINNKRSNLLAPNDKKDQWLIKLNHLIGKIADQFWLFCN